MSVISHLETELKKVYLLEARQEERRKRLVLKTEKIKNRKRKRIERQKRLKSLPIKDIRLTSAYKKWRQAVMKQANYKCEICNEPAIDVHHIIPVCVNISKMLDTNNGQALCLKCHRLKHPNLPDCFFYKRFGIKSVVKKPTSVILEA